ncbi:PIPO, partial [Canna yellow streak virus]|uniref:PIPO n=1 Tax=Canna yellow streak virus TaxID=433462 RepID=UPI0002655018
IRKRHSSCLARARLCWKIISAATVVCYQESKSKMFKTNGKSRFRRNLQYISNAIGFRVSRETSHTDQIYFSETPEWIYFNKACTARRNYSNSIPMSTRYFHNG